MSLIEDHLDKARNELVLAYNTAKNAKLPDSTNGIARMLADVSAELQYHQYCRIRAEKGLDTDYE
jgi:hypothetical protein